MEIKARVREWMEQGKFDRILAWRQGELAYEREPAVFGSIGELEKLCYDDLCVCNLSKYLIAEMKKPGRIGILLKPCDSYALNLLLQEHRVERERVFAIAVGCEGRLDIRQAQREGRNGAFGGAFGDILDVHETEDPNLLFLETLQGEQRIARQQLLAEKCRSCQGRTTVLWDERLETALENEGAMQGSSQGASQGASPRKIVEKQDRMEPVRRLEAMQPRERFAFWQKELSRCIRCNACRNVCPACSCVECIFDWEASQVSSKANASSFEESMYHIIRAFHVAGRCIDCGECSRVCPQQIPLHLLNRKFIKDINEFYGEHLSGADGVEKNPLTSFEKTDREP